MAAAQSKTSGLSPAQESQAECLDACEAGDVKCQSYCITVPSPNEADIEKTTKCAADCDQGKGSASDTEKYSACVQECIADNYWKSVDGSPRATGAAGAEDKVSSAVKSAVEKATGTASDEDSTATASAAESDATETGATKTASDAAESAAESASSAAESAAASETGNAANVLAGGMSFLGLAAAVLAL
jgi:cobalamin biosynthesis Mg chelatase CobN